MTSTSKPRVSPFGAEYEQLLLTAFANAPFRFPMASQAQVTTFKPRVYAYFRALREENLRLDLIEMADNLSLVTDGSCLVFQLKEDNWDNVAIRTALGLEKGFKETGNPNGGQLAVPDLLQTRLMKQLTDLRARRANSPKPLTPFKL